MSAMSVEKTVILLEDKDFFFTQWEIDRIVELHNNGLHYTTTAKQVKRDPMEIILCLLDAAAPETQELKGTVGEELIVKAKIIKRKKKQPKVIDIDGERYVLEHKKILKDKEITIKQKIFSTISDLIDQQIFFTLK